MLDDVRQYGETDDLAVIPLTFDTDYVARGKDKNVPRDYVILGRIGDAQYRQHHWIDRISGERSEAPLIWSAIRGAYENWKKGGEIVREGTPLAAVAFVPKRAVEAYRMLNIHTVETLAKVEDGDLPKLGLDSQKHRDMARQYVATQSSETTKLAARAQEAEDKIAALQAQIAELTAGKNRKAA